MVRYLMLLQYVVCSHPYLTWHEPVVFQSGQCFDWPVGLGKCPPAGKPPGPDIFHVEVKCLNIYRVMFRPAVFLTPVFTG